MGIEYKSILFKSIFTQTNQLVVIFITKHFFITQKCFDASNYLDKKKTFSTNNF